MDLSLPGTSGVDATAQIRRRLPQQKVLAVKTVLAGRRFISQEMTNLLLDGVLHPGQAQRETNRWETLSSRERTIFKLIAEGGTNRSAAAYLNLSTKTVEKHRANLMRKLQLASAVELALLAVEMGLIDRPQIQRRMQMDLQKGEAVGVAG